MKAIDSTWAVVFVMTQVELRDGIMEISELHSVIERYRPNSLNCLPKMVQTFMGGKMIGMAVGMMIEEEAEEASIEESVDSFQYLQ